MSENHPRIMSEIDVPTGPTTIRVGALTLRVPTDTQVVAGPGPLTYLRIGVRVYCFSGSTQISVPPTLFDVLRRSYFP